MQVNLWQLSINSLNESINHNERYTYKVPDKSNTYMCAALACAHEPIKSAHQTHVSAIESIRTHV